jgi:short-subunit dehydrogenase
MVKDLARPGVALEIFDELRDCPIEVLVNNAGFGLYGRFVENELPTQTAIMQVNMNALVELTYLFVKPMLERRHGRILNVASTAAFQPGPLINVYYASKAFVFSFSYALAEELRGTGVTVTTLCPGTTATEFFARGNFGPVRAPFTMGADEVATIGYRAMMKGTPVVIAGWINRLAAAVSRRLPSAWTMAIVRRVHRRR